MRLLYRGWMGFLLVSAWAGVGIGVGCEYFVLSACKTDLDCKGGQSCELARCKPRSDGQSAEGRTETTVDAGREATPEAPAEALQEAPAEALQEAPAEALQEAPIEIVAESPPEPRPEEQAEVSAERPSEKQPDAPNSSREVLIPAGTFWMGSPPTEIGRLPDETLHQVTLTRPFYIQKYEVTQGEFRAKMGYNPSYFSTCGGDCPVEAVNRHIASAYANAASREAGLPECFHCTGTSSSTKCDGKAAYEGAKYYTCRGYRLPTEAEWEYAYRAGTSTALYNGDLTDYTCNDPKADVIAWYCGNSQPLAMHPVGQKQPNAWGLYDMAGNVSEWVFDTYADYPTQAVVDPIGAGGTSGSSSGVVRGGCWDNYARWIRGALRCHADAKVMHFRYGIRLVRTAP